MSNLLYVRVDEGSEVEIVQPLSIPTLYAKVTVPAVSASPASASPLSVQNCQLWLDAQSLNLADGVAVQTWTDKSPNTNSPTQATPAQRPTFKAAGLNGKPGVLFSPAPAAFQFLSTALTGKTAPASRVFTCFAVAQNASNAAYASYGVVDPAATLLVGENLPVGGTATWSIGGYFVSPQNLTLGQSGYVETGPPSVGMQWLSGVNLLEMAYDGTTLTGWRNGVAMGSDPGPYALPSSGSLVVGNTLTSAGTVNIFGQFLGTIGEVIFYDRALSDSERQSIEAYLTDKWGIHA